MKFLSLLAGALLFVSAGCSHAQNTPPDQTATPAQNTTPVLSRVRAAKKLRLFVIGNSFSGNAMAYFPQIAKDGGYDVTLGRAEVGGAPLEFHAGAVQASEKDPNDAKGKPYSGQSLREKLSGEWDVVTIQQGSFVSSAIDTFQPHATILRDFIQKMQPRAQVMMHQTWAYRSDADKFGAVRPNHLAETQKEMWEESRAAYQKTAKELGVPLIPVGDAFWRASSDPAWGYQKDAKFDFANPTFPHLPDQTHSLNVGYAWSKDKKFGLDARHANSAGCYLAGLVWYGFLSGESPQNVRFAPPEVAPDFAAYLRKVAAETLGQKATLAPIENIAPAPDAPGLKTTDLNIAVLKASADTSIRGGELSSRSFGALDILRVRHSQNLVSSRKALVRFDLAGLPSPLRTAKSAALSLAVGAAEGASPLDKNWTFAVYGLKDGDAGENWGENTTNWDNAPGHDPKTASGVGENATSLGTFTISGKGERGQTVRFASPGLLEWLQSDSDGKATILIARQDVGDGTGNDVVHIFAARENSALEAPALSVGF